MDSIYELKQRMNLLERAHASAGMGHFVLDPKRLTIEFSSWVRDNIGLNDMPIPLDRLPEIVVEEERDEFTRTVAELIERKEDFSFETVVMTAKGKARTQRISGITAFENERTREGLIGYFGILQEITHEKRSKDELRSARDVARAELDARTNLLAIVSHEIRTPLGGILGIIDQLKREQSSQERERALMLIEESSEVLLDTLDGILQQARLDEHTGSIDAKRFRPVSVAQRVAGLFRPLARRKGIRIEASGPADEFVVGDPIRLQQAIANFVSNGVKFTQTGKVSIEVLKPSADDDQWQFVISDTGSGMDEARLAEIFQPFGASGEDSLGRSVGAGLGLSITKDLVNSLGGIIDVESELGRGSTFTIRVPFENAPNEDEVEASSPKRGSAAIFVKRASDRVQAEALVNMHHFELVDLEAVEACSTNIGTPALLIADQDNLAEFSPELFARFDRIVAIVSDGAMTWNDVTLPGDVDLPVSIVNNTHMARMLGGILAEDRHDSA